MKLTHELAEEEISLWLDHMDISEKNREDFKPVIDVLINAMVDGHLTVTGIESNDLRLKQLLKFPPKDDEGNSSLTEIIYKSRLSVGDSMRKLNKYPDASQESKIAANIEAAGSLPAKMAMSLDIRDYRTASAIGAFFLY